MTPKTVVVTGFGLFRDYIVNASWEVARVLPETGIAEELNINLVTVNIPVSYKDVDQIVPTLWVQHEPALMVHLGVSHLAKTLTVELVANGHGYCGLKMECADELDICTSRDAGRYLCEYIYFKSLSINKNQTIFIHVPQLDQDNTAQKLAEKLKCVIRKLLEQVIK
ncbi:pyroglutamyl-peptidase 1-like isoform X2 [Acyrthosiphon pisum]|uniref:Pyroglutamyl-peptidase 1 n=1 Tax=Acyrthosiphon pisum TaxID=7029 RepID=A0A8R2F852_ACYPI|nr:pyroglutamyl-peptidase 1-like isoform X2 [Acyrthosiphon pisum]|eukprot:XP_008182323.1 PREDICTED: pyroglutamyl-peptidase 1-like isoform X1 [Acyrthosiphon pisum]